MNTERDKTMATPYTAYVTPTTPDVIEYTVHLSSMYVAERKISAIKAVRVVACDWVGRNEHKGMHPLAGLREAKDFVVSIIAAIGAAQSARFVVAMPKDDESIHEALIAIVLCHLRVPFTLELRT